MPMQENTPRTVALNDALCRAAKPGDDIGDVHSHRGLRLRVSKANRKTWVYRCP